MSAARSGSVTVSSQHSFFRDLSGGIGSPPEGLVNILSKVSTSCLNASKEFPIGFRATDYSSSGSSFFNMATIANAREHNSSGVNARSSSSNDPVPVCSTCSIGLP
jgi:hypothetical protein